MKIKKKAVTNSSSCSFIIYNKKPIEVAKIMSEIYFNNYKSYDKVPQPHPMQEQVMKWIEDNPDFEGNICLPWTCSYQTFIYKDWFEKVVVHTCSNEIWDHKGLDFEYYEEGYGDEYSYEQMYLDFGDFKFKTRVDIGVEEWVNLEPDISAEEHRKSIFSQYLELDERAKKLWREKHEDKTKESN